MYVLYKMVKLYDGVMDESAQLPVSEARAQFSDLVNRVGYGKERIVLTRHGKPLVALVPAEELEDPQREPVGPAVLDLSSQSATDSAPLSIAAEHRTRPPTARG